MDKMREAFEKWKSSDNNYGYVDVGANSLETFKAGALWQAAQSAAVPVVGEVVGWRWFDSMDDLVISELDPLELGINASVLEPLIVRPTTSITAAELDALRKDAERYREALIVAFQHIDQSTHCNDYALVAAAIAGEK